MKWEIQNNSFASSNHTNFPLLSFSKDNEVKCAMSTDRYMQHVSMTLTAPGSTTE